MRENHGLGDIAQAIGAIWGGKGGMIKRLLASFLLYALSSTLHTLLR